MGFPLPLSREPFLGNDGKPLANGRVHTYAAGTSTPLESYADAGLTVLNANPVQLDPTGRAPIFVAAGVPYKIVVTTAAGAIVYTEDGLEVPATAAAAPAVTIPPGVIMAYGGAAAPAGWVLCDGGAYGRTDPLYAALFAIIGTTYGNGNGTTTFNVPDLRGRFPLGKAAAGTGSTLGGTGGVLDHVHTGPSHSHTIPAHTHTVPAHAHSVPRNGWSTQLNAPPLAGTLQAGGSGAGSEASATQANADAQTGASSALVTSSQALTSDAAGTGNTGAANPPYQVVNFIVKL